MNPGSSKPVSRLNAPANALAVPLLVFLFAAIVFAPTIGAQFVDLDDFELLINNDKWRGLGGQQIRWMFSTTLLGHYQPLTWLSYAINFRLGEMEPEGYHAVNVVLHAVNAVLVYLVSLRVLRAAGTASGAGPLSPVQERLGAGIGAILWAAHPLRAESVAWITERRDVLSTFFLLAAMLAYLKAAGRAADGRRRLAWLNPYAASIALLNLSLLSKSWGMSFFVVAIVLDWYPLRRLPVAPWKWLSRPYRAVLVEKIPHAALGIAFAMIIGRAFHSTEHAMRSLEVWPLINRCSQAAYGLVFYLWKSIAPSSLAPLYELPLGMNPFAPKYLLCYGIVAVAAILTVICIRRAPAVSAAAVIYAVLLAPILGFFQSGDQFVADRYSYVAMIGWSILAGGAIAHAIRWAKTTGRMSPTAIMSGAAVLLLAYGALALNQGSVWRNSLTLWEHAVKSGVTTPAVRVNYGLNLEREGRPDEAVEQFRFAVADRPTEGRGWFVLAGLLKRMNRLEEADEAYVEADKHLPQRYIALMNHGQLLLRIPGRETDGLARLREAVAEIERPGAGAGRRVSGVPYLVLGSVLWNRGEQAEARVFLRKALSAEDTREEAARHLKAIGDTP